MPLSISVSAGSCPHACWLSPEHSRRPPRVDPTHVPSLKMIEVPTVLVLGAGASAPYEFPTGEALLKRALTSLSGHENNDFQVLQRICEVAPPSLQSSFFQLEIERFVAA